MQVRRILVPALASALFMTALARAQQPASPLLTPVPEETIDGALTEDRNGRLFRKGSDIPLTATIVEHFPSGARKMRFAVVDGRAEGVWMEWYETGTPRYIATWRAGGGEGVWMYFHESGVIRERSNLIADMSEGPVEGWYPDGVKQFEGFYRRSQRTGRWQFWNPQGRLARTELYPSLFAQIDASSIAAFPFLADSSAEGSLDQWEFAFTRDGRTLYHATGGDTTPRRIVMRRWDRGRWSAPITAPFSRPGRDGGSFISPDGEWLYFSRSDSVAPARRDLYRVALGDSTAIPERLTRTPAIGEINVSLDRAGRGYLWADRTESGSASVNMRAVTLREGKLIVDSSLISMPGQGSRGLNSPFIDPQGRFVLFANYGVTRGSQEDLFVSRITDGVLEAPQPLGALVNTNANETSPYLSPDGRFLLFSSDRPLAGRPSGRWRIWAIPVSQVAALQAR